MFFPTSGKARQEVLARAREIRAEILHNLARTSRPQTPNGHRPDIPWLEIGDSWVAVRAARDFDEEHRNCRFWARLFPTICLAYRHQTLTSCHAISEWRKGEVVIIKILNVGVASSVEDLKSGTVEFMLTEPERQRLAKSTEKQLRRVTLPLCHPWRLTVRLGRIVRITV